MRYLQSTLVVLCSNLLVLPVFAGTQGEVSPTSLNQDGFFLGVGGSYNNGQVSADTSLTLTAANGFPPLAVFAGSTGSYKQTAQRFSPEAQLGYFKYLSASQWLWGVEFLYQYSNLSLNAIDFSTLLASPSTIVRDTLQLGGVRNDINHSLMLPFFLGHSYSKGFVYGGIGPSVFYTTQRVAYVDESHSANYIGIINGLAKSQWVPGGAAQVGLTYYLNPSWFLKINYTCAFSGNYSINKEVAFVDGVNNGLNSGSLTLNTRQSLITQEAALSINKLFA